MTESTKGNGSSETLRRAIATMRDHQDAWQNIVTGLGTAARDKRLGGQIVYPPIVASREQYEYLFTSDDIAARVVELPARDMVREWFTVTTEDSTEEDSDTKTEAIEDKMDAAKGVQQKLDDLKAKRKLYEALVWAKVHGASLLFLGVDDGHGDDLTQPLNVDGVRSFDFMQVFDRFDVSINSKYPFGHPMAGHPETYQLNSDLYDGASTPIIHESRFIKFEGVLTSRQRKRDNGGWPDSIYVRLESVLRDFGLTWGGVANLMSDFAQAIFKMRGLKDAIASDADDLVLARIAVMDMCRGINRIVPIDSEDEDFMRTTTPVTGLPDLLDRFAQRLSAAAEMPITLLMGMSPAGLNATGESDITHYYDQISNRQETELKDALELLVKLVFKTADGPTRGAEPDAWSIKFNPLWQLDAKEEAAAKKTTAETDAIYITNGVLSPDEVAQSRFGGSEYSSETQLDMEAREGDQLTGADIEAAIEAAKAEAMVEPDDQMPDPAASGTEESITAPEALNGAQVQALVTLAQEVQSGNLSRESAMAIILSAFPIDEATADRILPEEGSKPEPEPPPNPFMPGGGEPAAEPDDGDEEDEDRDDVLSLDASWVSDRIFNMTKVRLDFHADVITKVGSKWIVKSKEGKVLGEHDTREEAIKHLAAIEVAKAKRKK